VLTRPEADALYESLKSILGVRRAQEFWVDVITDNPHLDPDAEVIGKAHAAPVARPRSVEP